MREEVITVVRYSLELRREVLMRLTYSVGEGPRPDDGGPVGPRHDGRPSRGPRRRRGARRADRPGGRVLDGA